jgi:hypothetical protein
VIAVILPFDLSHSLFVVVRVVDFEYPLEEGKVNTKECIVTQHFFSLGVVLDEQFKQPTE